MSTATNLLFFRFERTFQLFLQFCITLLKRSWEVMWLLTVTGNGQNKIVLIF